MARVVVVGGGIGGLGCALFLAPLGHEVTILDRDPADLPADTAGAWSEWPRRGVPQFRHIHLFKARGRNLLRDDAPVVLAALHAAGAGEIRLDDGTDDDLVRLTCRRTTYEHVLRAAMLSDGRVRFVGGTRVIGSRAKGRRITGVRTDDGTEWSADLVVDASGRRSKVPTWLGDVALPAPIEDEQAEGTVGYTRWYRLRSESQASLLRADLGYAVGVVAPADNGMFCVTFGCLAEDPVMRSLRHPAAFDAAVAAVRRRPGARARPCPGRCAGDRRRRPRRSIRPQRTSRRRGRRRRASGVAPGLPGPRPPSSYWGNPEITARVEAVWRGIERPPPPAAGPDHQTMRGLLAANL